MLDLKTNQMLTLDLNPHLFGTAKIKTNLYPNKLFLRKIENNLINALYQGIERQVKH